MFVEGWQNPGDWFALGVSTHHFTNLDDRLCQAANQSKHKFPLCVESQFWGVDDPWTGWRLFGELLPRIREKGRVRVVDHSKNIVLDCSDKAIQSRGRRDSFT